MAALGTLYHEVGWLNDQSPLEKRGETFKINTLMKVVERFVWSRNTEEDVMQGKLKYHNLYTMLPAALVIWSNEVRRSGRDPEQVDNTRIAATPGDFMGYGSKYAFAKKPAPRQRILSFCNTAPRTTFASRPRRDKCKIICFKCRKPGHYRSECKEQESCNMIDAARSRMKEIGGPPNATTAQVLFELVMEENDYKASYELEAAETSRQLCSVFDTLAADHIPIDSEEDAANDEFTALVDSSDAGVQGMDFPTPDRT